MDHRDQPELQQHTERRRGECEGQGSADACDINVWGARCCCITGLILSKSHGCKSQKCDAKTHLCACACAVHGTLQQQGQHCEACNAIGKLAAASMLTCMHLSPAPACAHPHAHPLTPACLPAGDPGRAGHMAARADLQHQRRHLAAVRVQFQGAVPGQRQRAVPVLPARRHRAAGQRLPYNPALNCGLLYVLKCSGGGYWQPCSMR